MQVFTLSEMFFTKNENITLLFDGKFHENQWVYRAWTYEDLNDLQENSKK